jgi:hypothetical protein
MRLIEIRAELRRARTKLRSIWQRSAVKPLNPRGPAHRRAAGATRRFGLDTALKMINGKLQCVPMRPDAKRWPTVASDLSEPSQSKASTGQLSFPRAAISGSSLLCGRKTTYGVEIRPLLVATIQRLPQRTIDSTRPTPGTVSPRFTVQMPSGPSKTAVPLVTSRSIQPSMVVGLVSGTGVRFARECRGGDDVFDLVSCSTPFPVATSGYICFCPAAGCSAVCGAAARSGATVSRGCTNSGEGEAAAGSGGDLGVDIDNNQSSDKAQRLTISLASSRWECQANVAPTPISAAMEERARARDVRPRANVLLLTDEPGNIGPTRR